MLAWDLGCDGSAAGLLEIRAGGSRLPTSAATVADREHYLKMTGQEVFRRAVHAVVDSATVTPERADVLCSGFGAGMTRASALLRWGAR